MKEISSLLLADRVFHVAFDAPQFGEELPEHPPIRLSAIEIHQFAFAAFVNARIEDDALDGVLPRRIVALFDQTQQTAPILSAAVRVHDVLHPRVEAQQVFLNAPGTNGRQAIVELRGAFDRTVADQRDALDDDGGIPLQAVYELLERRELLLVVGQITADTGTARIVLQFQGVALVAEARGRHYGRLFYDRIADNEGNGIPYHDRIADDTLLDDGFRNVECCEAGGLCRAFLLSEAVNEVQRQLRGTDVVLRTGADAHPAVIRAILVVLGIDIAHADLALHTPPFGEVPPVTVRK